MRQHVAQIFAGVLAPGEVQRDALPLFGRNNAGSKHARAIIRRLARHAQHAHSRVVIMQNFALRRLPDQFIGRSFDHFRLFFHDLPLRGGGQRNPQ